MPDYESLRSLGLNLIPCLPKSKHPAVPWLEYKEKKYTGPLGNDNAAVMCGVTSGNLVVIDIDKDGLESKYFGNFDEVLKHTLVVKTGKGKHVYCHPKGNMIPIIKLIDVNNQPVGELRGQGGYVMAPGSIHDVTGKTYEIISSTTNIESIDIDGLLTKLREAGIRPQSNLPPINELLRDVPVGNRDNATFKYAAHLIGEGFTYDEVLASVKTWSENLGFAKVHVSAVKSAWKRVPRPTEPRREIIIPPQLKLHEVSPEHVGKEVTFNGVITYVEEEKAYPSEADFKCWGCKAEKHVVADKERRLKSPYCNTCKKRYSMVYSTEKYDSVRTIILQEPMDESINNRQETKYAKITGNISRSIYNGQRKKITGIVSAKSREDKFDEYDVWINVIDVEELDNVTPLYPNEKEMEMILKAVKDEHFIDTTLIPSYAPDIVGNNGVKEGMILAIVSDHIPGDNRTESHFAVVGDASVSKSRLLKFGHEVYPGSTRAVGKGATGVGLTYSINTNKDRTTFISPGPVIMGSGYACFIDEFDKMNADDRSVIHEIMEDRSCTINKGKHHFTNAVFTTIFTMANPKTQRWDEGLTLQQNINLPPPLISRFDQIWRILDKSDSILDEQIAKQIIKKKKGTVKTVWDKELLTKYFNYVRKLNPELTEEAEKELIDFYVKTRKTTNEKGIDPRGFEGLCRMSVNRAKLFLREKVEIEDVKAVIELYRKMLISLGLEPDTEGLDQTKLFETKKVTKEKVFFEVWNKCKDEEGLVNRVDFLEELSQTKFYDKESASLMFKKYEDGGKLLVSSSGKYRLI
jgi:replicative DNA helicase Mcm